MKTDDINARLAHGGKYCAEVGRQTSTSDDVAALGTYCAAWEHACELYCVQFFTSSARPQRIYRTFEQLSELLRGRICRVRPSKRLRHRKQSRCLSITASVVESNLLA